jgi:hypothetical protein
METAGKGTLNLACALYLEPFASTSLEVFVGADVAAVVVACQAVSVFFFFQSFRAFSN